jgi:diguanylate cyclase (GGDEF)-like protein
MEARERRAVGRSLRARWSRALAVFLAVFVVGALANFVGTRSTTEAFRAVAERMEGDADALAELRTDIVSAAVLRSAVVQKVEEKATLDAAVAQEDSSFKRAIRTFRPGAGREILQKHYAAAKALWPVDITTLSPAEFLARSARGRANFNMLDEAAAAGRAGANTDLARAVSLQRKMTLGAALTSLLLIALVVRFARRLSSEVLGPVARLRDSADRLATGDLHHRVEVDRADELGDLAATFNAMADVIATSHRDLTIQASHDALTGLANRAAFHSRLEAVLAQPERREGTAVLFVDLDDFKDVNDGLGHTIGDEVLQAVATRLTTTVRPGDLVARLGGDEFALLLDGVSDPAVALDIAQRAVVAIAVPMEVGGTTVQVGASAGLAMRQEGSDVGTLMREADMAMYVAKGQGKNRVARYGATAVAT